MRDDAVKNVSGLGDIAQSRVRQGHPPLHIDGIALPAFQLADLGARGIFIAFGKVDFRQSQTGIAVIGLLTQHRVILRNRRLAIAALLRPVRQRQPVANQRRLLLNEGDSPCFLAAVAQLVSQAYHLSALQARVQLTNVIRPLAARQGSKLRQRQIVLIITG